MQRESLGRRRQGRLRPVAASLVLLLAGAASGAQAGQSLLDGVYYGRQDTVTIRKGLPQICEGASFLSNANATTCGRHRFYQPSPKALAARGSDGRVLLLCKDHWPTSGRQATCTAKGWKVTR